MLHAVGMVFWVVRINRLTRAGGEDLYHSYSAHRLNPTMRGSSSFLMTSLKAGFLLEPATVQRSHRVWSDTNEPPH